MKNVYLFFAAGRYWPDAEKLQAVYRELADRIAQDGTSVLYVDELQGEFPEGDCAILVPLSGAVQRLILQASGTYECCILYGAYVRGNASEESLNAMLYANAAPTLMDSWAVTHRTRKTALLALNEEELAYKKEILAAYHYVRGARILKIGETEPWVISNAACAEAYCERFGVEIVPVRQQEVVEIYEGTSEQDGALYRDYFVSNSQGCKEPDERDICNASRMAAALTALMDRYEADGAAIACFDLLRTGTNMCLGVSYINDCTDRFISCECDMDSAVTMLMMKQLTKGRLWMANPGLHPDGTVNFSHCTGPIHVMGNACPCVLRSHHESGIGVSLQIDYPIGARVTACRVSDNASKITIQMGTSVEGAYEPCCRTQMHVRFDDFEHYLDTALGCHQVFAFEDIGKKMRSLADLLDLTIV